MALGFGGLGSEIARGVVVMGYDDSAVEAGLARTEGRLHGFAGTGAGVLSTLAVGFGLAAVAGVKMADDFEQSMLRVEALVGVSKDQIHEWSADILKLSGETGKAPTELAKGLFFVASAGFKGKEAIDVLTASAKASAAGLGETKVIADAVTSAVNAYGIANLSASRATDILIAAVKAGKLEPEELAKGLGRVLPLASALKIPFDQVAAAIASMTRINGNARMSTFSLTSVLSTLVKPTKAARDEFASLGYSIADIRKSVAENGLLPTLSELQRSLGTNVETIGKAYPNVRALTAVLTLLGKNAKATGEVFDATKNSVGATDEAFKIMQQDTGVKLHRLFNDLRIILIRLGFVILPTVDLLAGALLKVVEVVTNLISKLSPLKPVLVTLAGAFLLVKTQALATAILMAVRMPAAIVASTIAMVIQEGVLGTLAIAWEALTAVLLANPIGLIVTALALLGLGLYEAWKHSETFRDVVKAVFKVTADVVATAMRVITFQLSLFLRGLSILADAATHLPFVGDKFKGVSDKIDAARETLDGFIDAIDGLGEKKVVDVQVNVNYKTFGLPPELGGGTDPLNPTKPAEKPRSVVFKEPGLINRTTPDPNKPGTGTTTGVVTGKPLPIWIQQRQADADLSKQNAAILAADQLEVTWLKRRLADKNLKDAERLDYTQRLTSAEGRIQSILDGENQKAQQARDDAAKKEADRVAHQFDLPERISTAQAKALADKDLANDIAAKREEAIWLLRQIQSGKAHGKALADLYTRRAAALDELDRLRKDKAGKKGKDPAATGDRFATPERILLAQAKARKDESLTNDIAALEQEKAFVQRAINSHKAKGKELTDLYNRLYDIRDKIAQDRKDAAAKDAAQSADLIRSQMALTFLGQKASFVDKFAGDVFRAGTGYQAAGGGGGTAIPEAGKTTNVTVNQHFPHPPTEDGFREARLSKIAVEASYDG